MERRRIRDEADGALSTFECLGWPQGPESDKADAIVTGLGEGWGWGRAAT